MPFLDRNSEPGLLERAALGAAAGLVGTVVIQAIEAGTNRVAPKSSAPIEGDPGMFAVQTAEQMMPEAVRNRVPDAVENITAQSLGYLYGMTWGVLYAAVRPRAGSITADGTLLGLACWAAGYLGWLPASRMLRPPWQQRPAQLAVPAAQHVGYGLATLGAYELLAEQLA